MCSEEKLMNFFLYHHYSSGSSRSDLSPFGSLSLSAGIGIIVAVGAIVITVFLVIIACLVV